MLSSDRSITFVPEEDATAFASRAAKFAPTVPFGLIPVALKVDWIYEPFVFDVATVLICENSTASFAAVALATPESVRVPPFPILIFVTPLYVVSSSGFKPT